MSKLEHNISHTLPKGPYLVFATAPGEESLLGGTLILASQAELSIGIVFVGECKCEQTTRMAVEKLGVKKCWFWQLADSNIQAELTLYNRIRTLIQSWQPTTIFAHFPEETQATHLMTAALVIAAIKSLNYQGAIWFYERQQQTDTNYLIDISPTIDSKRAAIACYDDQSAIHKQFISSINTSVEAFRGLSQVQNTPLFSKAYTNVLKILERLPNPLISVIIRTQNRPHLLAKALQSIAKQTYKPVEAVVVNDGGCEITSIVAQFEPLFSGGMQLIEHTEVRGRSAAANSGLHAANGKWIAFLDDDDNLEPEGLAHLAQFIAWDKDIIYGQVQVLNMAVEPEKHRHITGKNRTLEICYRRLFFEKHLDSLSSNAAEALQRASINLITIRDNKMGELHTHYQTLINKANGEYASKIAHVQTAYEKTQKQLAATLLNNQAMAHKIREMMTRTIFHFAFEPKNNLFDLSAYGLAVSIQFSSTVSNKVDKVIAPLTAFEFPMPVTKGLRLQWSFIWKGTMLGDTLLLKLATYGRVNQCHLNLIITPTIGDTIQASLDGQFVKNNQYAAFSLNKTLPPGEYICQLSSPDTDNLNHLLGICLSPLQDNIDSDTGKNYQYVPPDRDALSQITFEYQPVISVLIPTYNTPAPFLRACLDSVLNQIYPYWELCIADDASIEPQVREVLEDYQKRFPTKIKIAYCENNRHISATTNVALAQATGDFVALLDHDDLLTKDAFFEIVKCLNEDTEEPIDLIYSDEDKWDGSCFDEPFFKPNWAPEILKGQMYIGHLGVYRKSLLEELGGFRLGVEGSQDWDLALRVTEKARDIQHIPKILYHWRKHINSTASSLDNKNYAVQAGLKVVQDALIREEENGQAILNPKNNTVLVSYPVKNKPLVSIIIPTKDKADLLKHCIDSITRNTDYPNWEIIIVDNGSEENETFDFFESYQKRLGAKRFKIHHEPSPFNFSYLVNQGVKAAQGSIILLLNNDTELISPSNWLEEMVGYAQRDAIACVGCKLLYDDDTIQHAGIICGLGGIASHSHVHVPVQSPGYFARLNIVANYSGVTGACLMIKRSLWENVGGFDEALAVAFNDVDFCLRLLKQNYRHLVLPQVLFYHHESKSRGQEDTPLKQKRFAQEIEFMQKRWPKIGEPDPYYSPHFNQDLPGNFSINPESIYARPKIRQLNNQTWINRLGKLKRSIRSYFKTR